MHKEKKSISLPNTSICPKCHKTVVWMPTKGGKEVPVEPYSLSPGDTVYSHYKHNCHWDFCHPIQKNTVTLMIEGPEFMTGVKAYADTHKIIEIKQPSSLRTNITILKGHTYEELIKICEQKNWSYRIYQDGHKGPVQQSGPKKKGKPARSKQPGLFDELEP